MRVFRRSLVALGVAAMLPTIVFAAVGVFYFLSVERDRVEDATLARAAIIMDFVDARLKRDLAVLELLASSDTLEAQAWTSFYQRAQRSLKRNPTWRTVVLIDTQRNAEIVDLRHPVGDARPLHIMHGEPLHAIARSGAPVVGDVQRAEDSIVWIYAPVRGAQSSRYVLAAAISTRVFQDILMQHVQNQATGGIVDRQGNFIARSLHYEERVGTPATTYVREAIRGGIHGFYRGQTYEGLKNYTAFHTSSISSWSTHLAVASSLIDTPTVWSFAVAGLAGLGSVLLAGVLIVLILRDMAERRRTDEGLRQSQKMEAVGQLTGGIAHDFNNLLTAVIGNLDMIRSRTGDNERLQRMATNALEAARRGAKLASQLLAFSRTQRMTVGTIDLERLLNGMSGLLAQSVGPSVAVRIQVDPDAQFIISDPNQLELALLNLAVNARDAMSGTGTFSIRAQRARTVDRSLPAGDYVHLCCSDTGVGMSDEVRNRAIEPFFTTKATGQGTGLGLSQVYGVVRESGGALKLESEPGRGTTVCLTLRSASPDGAPAMTRPTRRPPQTAASGIEHRTSILVVDDDRLVRRLMTESLGGLGYRVVDAENGESALHHLEKDSFDLMLIDFAMPGMNGAEVAKVAQTKYPQLRILIVSGYADSAALEAALGSTRLLRKPFDLAELRVAVAEILGPQT